MKRQFCKWNDVGPLVAIRTSSLISSSVKVTAGSYRLVVLRLTRLSMTAFVMVISSVMVIPMSDGMD